LKGIKSEQNFLLKNYFLRFHRRVFVHLGVFWRKFPLILVGYILKRISDHQRERQKPKKNFLLDLDPKPSFSRMEKKTSSKESSR